jgi:hypothetical protein
VQIQHKDDDGQELGGDRVAKLREKQNIKKRRTIQERTKPVLAKFVLIHIIKH